MLPESEFIPIACFQAELRSDTCCSLAIPIITRFVADFLGFGHCIRTMKDDKREFSENEIYQHITDYQVFLAYNADETKMWKWRVAFKNSMKFLFDLAESGNVENADRFPITNWAMSLWCNKEEAKSKNIKDVSI